MSLTRTEHKTIFELFMLGDMHSSGFPLYASRTHE